LPDNDQVTLRLLNEIEMVSLNVPSGNVTLDMANTGSLSLDNLSVPKGSVLDIVNWDENTPVWVTNELDSTTVANTYINGNQALWNSGQPGTMTPVPEPASYALGAGLFFLGLVFLSRRYRSRRRH